jgi:hypothetical protein
MEKLRWIFEFEDGQVIIGGPPEYYEQFINDRDYVIGRYKQLTFHGRLIKVTIQ